MDPKTTEAATELLEALQAWLDSRFPVRGQLTYAPGDKHDAELLRRVRRLERTHGSFVIQGILSELRKP